jgi:5'-nucleotidase
MVKPFETLNVDISCLGNHELDHGLKCAEDLMAKTSSPWILTNLVNINDGKPIAKCEPYKIIEHQGFKFGMLGFAEAAWTDTFSPEIDIAKMKYIDYNESLRE